MATATTSSIRHSAILVRNVPEGTEDEDLEDVFKKQGWQVSRKADGTPEVAITGNRAVVTLADTKFLAAVLSKSGQVDLGDNRLEFGTANTTPQKVVAFLRSAWGATGTPSTADQALLDKQRKAIGDALKAVTAEETGALLPTALLELLQNADDNEYRAGITPSVELLLKENEGKTETTLHLVNNEVGFQEANVYALCGLALSTKTHETSGYLGEKGLRGFKTAFAASPVPTVCSNSYQFQFKHVPSDPLSFVIPHWLEKAPAGAKAGATTLVLPLRPKAAAPMAAVLKKVDAPLLLFMRKLRSLKLDLPDSGPVTLQRVDDGAGHIQLLQQTKNAKTTVAYGLVDQDYTIPPNMKQARHCPTAATTRLSLAFPQEGATTLPVYAYLPVADFGFRFILQGDFEFPGERTELATTPWNTWLRGFLPALFLKAVAQLQLDEEFGAAIYNFIPVKTEVAAAFFKPTVETILAELRKAECVLTAGGKWLKPDAVFFPPAGLLGEVLAAGDVMTAAGKAFLNAAIDVGNPRTKEVLTSLGVKEFTVAHFLGFLGDKKFLEGKSPEFLSRLYSLLTQLLAEGTLKPEALKAIPLLMLQSGALVAPAANPLYPPPGGYHPTHEFEKTVPLLHSAFLSDEVALALFQQLGLKEVSPASILTEYLVPHMAKMPADKVIIATQYAKEKADIPMQETLRAKGFLLVTTEGTLVRATDALLPAPFNPYPVQDLLTGVLPFVTTAYVPTPPFAPTTPAPEVWASWRAFLMRVGANVLFPIARTPTGGFTCAAVARVLEPGPFTRPSQLQHRAQLCGAVSALWPFLEPFTHTPKEPVTLFWRAVQTARWLPGSDGKLHRPCDGTLYLRTKAVETIMKDTVAYLQADVSPDVAKALTVKTEVPPELLVEKLANAALSPAVLVDIYGSLEACWPRCSPKVRLALTTARLFNLDGKLYNARELVWSDPLAVLKNTPALQGHFPTLQNFFVECLHIPQAPTLQNFITELEVIRDPSLSPSPGAPAPGAPKDPKAAVVEIPDDLTPALVDRVRRLYYGMGQCLVLQPDANIHALQTKPLFLTHRGDWVVHDKVIINDQPGRFTGLEDQPDIHFWDIPLECIPKVQAIARALRIPSLAALRPIGGAPDPKAVSRSDYLTKQVRSLVPYLLRYVFYRNHVHYVTLRKPWKYYSTAVWTAKTLPATYQYNGVQWSGDLPWFVKDDGEDAHILVGGDPERTLPRALAECFGASPLTIMGMLAAKTPGNLNTMLVDMGVGDLPPGELPPEMRPEVAEMANETAGQKRAAATEDGAPPAKRACPPNEAPLKLIPAISPDTLKELEPSNRDEIPQMNTVEARNQMRPWGQQYLGLVLLKNGMKDIQCTVAGPEAPPYDITYISHGWVHYGLIHCTLELRMPTLSLTPKQWQCALQYGNRYHVFVIRGACTNQACVSQLTDPAALVASGKWPCKLLFTPQG